MLKSVSSSVWPSPAALATSAAPTLPPAAPGRFSTSTGRPRLAPRRSERMRPRTSSGPPGGNGFTMRTGFDGYPCAAAWTATNARARSARRFKRSALGFVRRDRLLEIGVLGAGEEAELVEHAEVLLRLVHVPDHEIGLADVLVRAAVLRLDAQRLVVMLEHEVHVRVRTFADRVCVQVVVVGILRVRSDGILQHRGGGGPVLALGGFGNFIEHGIPGFRG